MKASNFTHDCTFRFVDLGNGKYKVRWVLTEKNGREVERREDEYEPRGRLQVADMNDARARINQWIRTKYFCQGIKRGIKFTCANDKSDFKTHSEKMREYYASRRKMESDNRALAAMPSTADVVSRDPRTGASTYKEVNTSGRRFEVKKVGDVWTIVVHDHELLTEQEAKTMLFAKIVNGD